MADKRKPTKKRIRDMSPEELSHREPTPVALRARSSLLTRARVMRQQARTDYIVDPEGRAVRFHYEREDREYKKTVAWGTFLEWSVRDKWSNDRDEFWRQIEQRVIEHQKDDYLKERRREYEFLRDLQDTYSELLLPLRDKDGNIKRDDVTGVPEFAMKLPKMDQFIKSYLLLHERVMLMRGEATSRSATESEFDPDKKPSVHVADPLEQQIELSPYESRALSRAFLHMRQPELAALEDEDTNVVPIKALKGVIDAPSE